MSTIFAVSQVDPFWKRVFEKAVGDGIWSAARSSGPGGQNVNKLETKVVLRWNPVRSIFSTEEFAYIVRKLGRFLTDRGDLVVTSETHRTREMNRKEVLHKLQILLEKAFFNPTPRKKTKPTKSSQRKRLDSKSRRKEIKTTRSKVRFD